MITFRRAVRENVGLVIGIAGPSGSGKTFSAMRLAEGISGGKPFAVIDTEAGRGKHYADRFTFDHGDLGPPFRPSAYAEAIKAADKAGYPVIVVDSCSHEHAGEGGLLDWHEEELDRMAKDDWKKRESCKMTAWIKPKMEHKQMVQRLLQVRAHLILCFRAEQKIDIVKNADGRMEMVPKKIASGFSDWIPICEKNILYELTASFLMTPDAPGIPKPIKVQAQHRAFIDFKAPLDESVGKKLAEWAAGGVPAIQPPAPKHSTAPAAATVAPVPAGVEAQASAPAPMTFASDANAYKMKIGRQKGQPVTDLDGENLEWALNYYLDKIRDQPNSRFVSEWEEAVLALQEEKTMREGVMGEQQ